MKRFRRYYYDLFSTVYDRVIALHSKDKSARLRRFLIEKSTFGPGQKLLDVCTGTGAVAHEAARYSRGEGAVVGVDFSMGMLRVARRKSMGQLFPIFVLSDVTALPFREESFNVVTCSHAMYELDPETRRKALSEFRRVLVRGGRFIMMEHTAPSSPFVRFFYNIRLMTMGSSGNRAFARDERPEIARFFKDVRLELAPGGRSKIVYGKRA